MRKAFIAVMSIAIGVVVLYAVAFAMRSHDDRSAADSNQAAARRANEAGAADYLAAAAAALRKGPLTVGELKTVPTRLRGPDRVDAAEQDGGVVISFVMTDRYAVPGSIGDAMEYSCFRGTVEGSGTVGPGQPVVIPCNQVRVLPDLDAKVSLKPVY